MQIAFKRDILNDNVHGLIHGQLFSLVRDPIKFECNVQSSSNHQGEEVLKIFLKYIHDQYSLELLLTYLPINTYFRAYPGYSPGNCERNERKIFFHSLAGFFHKINR